MDDTSWSRRHCPIPDASENPALHAVFEATLAGVPIARHNGKPMPQWSVDAHVDDVDPPPPDEVMDNQAAAVRWAFHFCFQGGNVKTACRKFVALSKVIGNGSVRRTDAELAKSIGCSVGALQRDKTALRGMLGAKSGRRKVED